MLDLSNEIKNNIVNDFMYDENEDFIDLAGFIDDSYQDENLEKIDTNEEKVESILDTFYGNREFDLNQDYWLTQDLQFKTFLVDHIYQRMKKAIEDSSTLYFKEIITILALLSLGKNRTIFYSYSQYNEKNLLGLFEDYHSELLINIDSDPELFEVNFTHYLLLLEALNEICIINAVDLLRKKTINSLIENMIFSINTIKASLELNENKLDKLNNLQGKFMLYYTHIPYFSSKDKDADTLIKEFEYNLERIIDGYLLLKPQKQQNLYKKTLLLNSSFLILTLLYKLENNHKTINIESLDHIVFTINNQCFPPQNIVVHSIEELKNILLDIFAYTQTHNSDLKHNDMINYVIQTDDLGINNLITIHNIILYANDITNTALISIAQKLLELERFDNDYHEHYKLKTLETIFIKLTSNDIDQSDIEPLFEQIIQYFTISKTATHMMNLVAKIYLDIALYYSNTQNDIQKTLQYYHIYQTINDQFMNNIEYNQLHEQLMINYANQYLRLLQLNKLEIPKNQLIHIGNTFVSKNLPIEQLKTKEHINNFFADMINEILYSNQLSETKISQSISLKISHELFFGLCELKIIGLGTNIITEDIGYETVKEHLFSQYYIEYKYPYAYKESFFKIYNKHKDFISMNIQNLIRSFVLKV